MKYLTRPRCTAALAAAILAVGMASAVPASASSGGGGVERMGDCSKASTWDLKASPQNGRIKVEAEIHSGITGQHWTWRLLHNGGTSAHGKAVTKDGGDFKVQRTMINIAGVDQIGIRASNAATGEACSGDLNY